MSEIKCMSHTDNCSIANQLWCPELLLPYTHVATCMHACSMKEYGIAMHYDILAANSNFNHIAIFAGSYPINTELSIIPIANIFEWFNFDTKQCGASRAGHGLSPGSIELRIISKLIL